MKNTENTHPDYKQLEAALQTIQTVAIGIDKSIMAQENVTKCLQIQNLFTNNLNVIFFWEILFKLFDCLLKTIFR